jgi:hypothetical protein
MKKLNQLPLGKEDLMLKNCYASFIDEVIRHYCINNPRLEIKIEFEVGSAITPYLTIVKNKYYLHKDIYNKLSNDTKVYVNGKDRLGTVVTKKGNRLCGV